MAARPPPPPPPRRISVFEASLEASLDTDFGKLEGATGLKSTLMRPSTEAEPFLSIYIDYPLVSTVPALGPSHTVLYSKFVLPMFSVSPRTTPTANRLFDGQLAGKARTSYPELPIHHRDA
uniref:Uncharacterized protein n=1 Tax=Eutreptiella gymnastica TaxID=73025 RepID=A0A7S1N389_9EUGL